MCVCVCVCVCMCVCACVCACTRSHTPVRFRTSVAVYVYERPSSLAHVYTNSFKLVCNQLLITRSSFTAVWPFLLNVAVNFLHSWEYMSKVSLWCSESTLWQHIAWYLPIRGYPPQWRGRFWICTSYLRHNASQKSPWSKRKPCSTVVTWRPMRRCYFVWHTPAELLRKKKVY